MPSIAALSIERPLYTWMLILVCIAGGIAGIDTIGRLEDPVFPIKNAFIITAYPGSSALEVEQEVTDVIEASIQELPYLDHVTSKSVPGRSEVRVELHEKYAGGDLPQIWDELRRRVSEAGLRLPPGTSPSLVEDDYGDVYGISYAVSAPDYSERDIHDMAQFIATRLKQVPGVAKVATTGEPDEAVYVELDHERLVSIGLPVDAVFASIGAENRVVAAGSVAHGERRYRIAPELAFDDIGAVADMRIGRPGSTEMIRLGDIATVTRNAVEIPRNIIRHGGERVFTVGVSVSDGENVVDVGQAVDRRLAAIVNELPLGVEVHPIYRQHAVVESAIRDFLRNLTLSIATVVGALCLFMGWRAGAVVGSVLMLTVLGTLAIMSLVGIELQRISLGALMIAMGMLVDNAIVVAEGMVVGVSRGASPARAATDAVRRTQFPLLGATVIGLLAFAPIGLSDDNSGYYLRSLFHVVSISLLLSWILAITVVPLLGSRLLRPAQAGPADPYSGWAYAPYRILLRHGLRRSWLTAVIILSITGLCLWSFTQVKQGFFTSDRTPLFYVDYFLTQGTDILATSEEILGIEAAIEEDSEVVVITSFIGGGMSRFISTLRPEQPNPSMAQLVVRVKAVATMDAVMQRTRERLADVAPHAQIKVRRSEFSPSGTSKMEARFSGPDANVLRDLAEQTLDVYLAHNLIDRATDWRQRELQIVPHFDETRARLAGIGRADVYQALAYATHGVQLGLFRDQDKLIPIVGRAPREERVDIRSLSDRTVWSPTQQTHIPMSQIISSFELKAVDATILRRDRIRTIGALANPPEGHNFAKVFAEVRPDVEAIPLPPGYALEWGGEYEASKMAERLLLAKVPATFGIMFFITVLMFGQLRQPIVIWLTVPMVACGVALSLLATDLSFTFPSFLGLLSLSGMLIKNCVVLIDEIDKRLAEEGHSLEVVVSASVSRLRPVVLAAGTTIAGMSPLLADPFFAEMAVCIMGGLAFATLLTLVAVPVFYRIALGRRLSSTVQAEAPGGIMASPVQT